MTKIEPRPAAVYNGGESGSSTPWTISDAVQTYNIDRWGLGYFSINERGNVTVAPLREAGATIDIMQ
ncbi:MAG: hypothetical protein N2111_00845, partial [Candidatus Sumerlaeaceae bacterium]|nr:hypothetical protein [Candidatus Sumerlaeaceae bacterium]